MLAVIIPALPVYGQTGGGMMRGIAKNMMNKGHEMRNQEGIAGGIFDQPAIRLLEIQYPRFSRHWMMAVHIPVPLLMLSFAAGQFTGGKLKKNGI